MTPFDTEQTDRLLMTTKAVRRRLDLERPVPREIVVDCAPVDDSIVWNHGAAS